MNRALADEVLQAHGWQRAPLPLWSRLLLGVIAAVLLLFGAKLFTERRAFLAQAVSTQGVVVKMRREVSNSGKRPSYTFRPVVRYTPAGAPAPVTFDASLGSSPPSWKVGQSVPVLYLPSEPEHADIADYATSPTPLIICFGLSALLTAGALLIRLPVRNG